MEGKQKDIELQKRRIALWKQGLTDAEIAQKEGVNVCTIASWRRKNGLKVNKVTKVQTKKKESLCFTCSRATAVHCPFIKNTRNPIAGLRAVGIKPNDVDVHISTSGKLYTVLRCPRYQKRPLPPIAWKGGGRTMTGSIRIKYPIRFEKE